MTAEDYTQAAALVTEECHRALTAVEQAVIGVSGYAYFCKKSIFCRCGKSSSFA